MNVVTQVITFIIMLVITYIVYMFAKKYIFNRVKINKWIPLSIAIALILVQILIGVVNPYISMGFSMLPLVFFLWFMDIKQTGGLKSKGKQIVIKPKAKPNRVKKNK